MKPTGDRCLAAPRRDAQPWAVASHKESALRNQNHKAVFSDHNPTPE